MTAVAPSGMPVLRTGAHLGPEDGACLMEYVSVLSGARFSDHPRCTDPTVAALARLVNDCCSDACRPQLGHLAPVLAATPPGGAARTAVTVRVAVRAACTAVGATPTLRRHLHRADRRLQRVTGLGRRADLARRLDRLYRRGAARRGLEVSVRALAALGEAQRDTVLVAMLTAALGAGGAGGGLSSPVAEGAAQGHRAQGPPPVVV